MADVRKTLGDLDELAPASFDGTEVMEAYKGSEGQSYKTPIVATAAANEWTGEQTFSGGVDVSGQTITGAAEWTGDQEFSGDNEHSGNVIIGDWVNGGYIGDLTHRAGPVRAASANHPKVCLSDGDVDIDIANYPDITRPSGGTIDGLVTEARSWKVEYRVSGSATDSWSVTVSGSDITFPAGTSDGAVLAAFVEDNEYHVRAGGTSWGHEPTVNIDGTDYVITGINLGTSVVTVTGSPATGAQTAIFYRHRIAGSTDTARLFESTGAAIHSPGDQAGEFVAGMRVRDQMQRITGSVTAEGFTAILRNDTAVTDGAFVDSGGFGTSRLARSSSTVGRKLGFNSAGSPNARASATTDGTTRSPGLVAHTYMHAGVYVA